MAACNVAGARVGSHLAIRHGSGFVRVVFIVVVGCLIAKPGWTRCGQRSDAPVETGPIRQHPAGTLWFPACNPLVGVARHRPRRGAHFPRLHAAAGGGDRRPVSGCCRSRTGSSGWPAPPRWSRWRPLPTVEAVAYFAPGVDHTLDVVAGPAAVAAGVVAKRLGDDRRALPTDAWPIAIIAGGGIARRDQGAVPRCCARSPGLATGGLGNPVLALFETLGATGIAVLAAWWCRCSWSRSRCCSRMDGTPGDSRCSVAGAPRRILNLRGRRPAGRSQSGHVPARARPSMCIPATAWSWRPTATSSTRGTHAGGGAIVCVCGLLAGWSRPRGRRNLDGRDAGPVSAPVTNFRNSGAASVPGRPSRGELVPAFWATTADPRPPSAGRGRYAGFNLLAGGPRSLHFGVALVRIEPRPRRTQTGACTDSRTSDSTNRVVVGPAAPCACDRGGDAGPATFFDLLADDRPAPDADPGQRRCRTRARAVSAVFVVIPFPGTVFHRAAGRPRQPHRGRRATPSTHRGRLTGATRHRVRCTGSS